MKRPKLSIVVPCYNEEACLEMLHARISAAAQAAVGQDYEIVLINDGSRDASWKVMQRLSEGDPRLVAINLSRNHGHQLALTAGLDLCAGEEILIIDADLQDPPEELTRFFAKCREGYDVVYAIRQKRKEHAPSWRRRATGTRSTGRSASAVSSCGFSRTRRDWRKPATCRPTRCSWLSAYSSFLDYI